MVYWWKISISDYSPSVHQRDLEEIRVRSIQYGSHLRLINPGVNVHSASQQYYVKPYLEAGISLFLERIPTSRELIMTRVLGKYARRSSLRSAGNYGFIYRLPD